MVKGKQGKVGDRREEPGISSRKEVHGWPNLVTQESWLPPLTKMPHTSWNRLLPKIQQISGPYKATLMKHGDCQWVKNKFSSQLGRWKPSLLRRQHPSGDQQQRKNTVAATATAGKRAGLWQKLNPASRARREHQFQSKIFSLDLKQVQRSSLHTHALNATWTNQPATSITTFIRLTGLNFSWNPD